MRTNFNEAHKDIHGWAGPYLRSPFKNLTLTLHFFAECVSPQQPHFFAVSAEEPSAGGFHRFRVLFSSNSLRFWFLLVKHSCVWDSLKDVQIIAVCGFCVSFLVLKDVTETRYCFVYT